MPHKKTKGPLAGHPVLPRLLGQAPWMHCELQGVPGPTAGPCTGRTGTVWQIPEATGGLSVTWHIFNGRAS